MPRFAANLTLMFTERPFLDRFGAAARAGFSGVECLFPYEHPAAEVGEALRAHGLTQALFNLPAGDFAGGERGLAALPGRETEFRDAVELAAEYAFFLGCARLHVMAGNRTGHDAARMRSTYAANLAHACERFAPAGIDLLIEPINGHDMPAYFLNGFALAEEVLHEVSHPGLKLQLDWYHAQILHGDLTRLTERLWPRVGHLQLASVPDRHEPDRGEVRYRHLFKLVDRLGYTGWIGCEYRPAGVTEEGLGWFREASRGG